MKSLPLEKQVQPIEPLDEATKAAIELGREQLRRGEGIPLDRAEADIRERIKAWRKDHKEVVNA